MRIITLAPELPGLTDSDALTSLVNRGVVVAIGHSTAGSDAASRAVRRGAKLITHLFNAMPQLLHRDPGIIGLIGASPASLVSRHSPKSSVDERSSIRPGVEVFSGSIRAPASTLENKTVAGAGSEALDEHDTPPQTPLFDASVVTIRKQQSDRTDLLVPSRFALNAELDGEDDEKAIDAERPYYGLIVDGVHSHPNSVRVSCVKQK